MLSYSITENKDKPTIVLIHGFALSEHIWDALTSLLHQHYQVIRINLPRSIHDVPSVEELESYISKEIHRIVYELGIEQFALLGHSMGGYLALGTLANDSERISHLILLNSTCFADSEERKEKRHQIIEHISNYGVKSLLNQAVPSWISKDFKENNMSQVLDIINQGSTLSQEILIYYQRYMIQRPDRSQWIQQDSLKTKRLIILGELDPLVAEADFDGLKNVSIHSIEGGAHMTMIETPQEVAKVIHSFLSR